MLRVNAGDTYGLGVSLGLSSFFAAQAATEKPGYVFTAEELNVQGSLSTGYVLAQSISNEITLDLPQMRQIMSYAVGANRDNGVIYNDVENLRGLYDGQIYSGVGGVASAAYRLGVSLAIAEGQSTAGVAARLIVRDSLNQALLQAQYIARPHPQLYLQELQNAIAKTGDPALPPVHEDISTLRGHYQGFLSGILVSVPAHR